MVSGPVQRANLICWFRNLDPLGKLLVITGIAAAIAVPLYDAAHDDYPVWNLPPASGG
jgi:hypothetical protein